jgi:hypothetical protein
MFVQTPREICAEAVGSLVKTRRFSVETPMLLARKGRELVSVGRGKVLKVVRNQA